MKFFDNNDGVVNPAVTVIVPVLNGERFLGAALDSLFAQTFTDFAVIVVDDGSVDRTAEILAARNEPRLRVVRNPTSLGPAAARNLGLDRTRSRYVAFFDADDVADPRRLEIQLAFLARHREVGLLAGRVAVIDAQGQPAGDDWGHQGDPDILTPSMLFRNCLATSTIVADRTVIGDERFDTNLPVASDYDMWLRLAERTTVACLADVVASYRVHPANLTHTRNANAEACLELIARRRLALLGIHPSTAELQLHRRLGTDRLEGTDQFMTALAQWLRKLERANRTARVYNTGAFRRVLQSHWLAACETAAREQGWHAWPSILRSSLLYRAALDPTAWGRLAHLLWRSAKTSLKHLRRPRAVPSSSSN